MGNKKNRNREKTEKKQIKLEEDTNNLKEFQKKKTNSIMWMLFAASALLLLWVSGFMSNTLATTSSPDEISANLRKDLSIENAESKGIIDCDDSLYVIYTTDNKTGLAKANRADKLYNRYNFVENKEFTKAINSLIHTSETNDITYIVLYGNIKDTKITNVEISYNDKKQLVPIESATNDYFITSIGVPKSENVKSIDLKFFNNKDEDITNEFK